MLRSLTVVFANTRHSQPHDEDSLRETFVQQHWREAWTSSTASNTYMIPFSLFTTMYRRNAAEHPGSNEKTEIGLEQIYL